MFAHSMGNVVASQALRVEGVKDNAQEIVHSYAACQAASVAFAYDATNPRTMTHGYISAHPGVTGAVQAGATLTAPESPEMSVDPVASVALPSTAAVAEQIASTMMEEKSSEIESLLDEMMRPIVRTWLSSNLPTLVERLVQEEIKSVSRGKRAS